jgi:hypothetical protein
MEVKTVTVSPLISRLGHVRDVSVCRGTVLLVAVVAVVDGSCCCGGCGEVSCCWVDRRRRFLSRGRGAMFGSFVYKLDWWWWWLVTLELW